MVVSNVGLVRVKSVKRDNPYCDDGLCKQASWGYEYGDAGAMGERDGDGGAYANPCTNATADTPTYFEIGDSTSPGSGGARIVGNRAPWGYKYGDAGAMGEREGDGSVYANPHANPSADAAMYVEIGDPSSVSPASSAAYFDVVPHDDDDLYMTTAGAADATDANVNAASPGSDNSFWQ